MTTASHQRSMFPAGRIVALALIAIVVSGLAYLRFAPDNAISVPAGAKAGDIDLHPCRYSTEAGSYQADCGTLVVPENRKSPTSRLIALPVTRVRARSAHHGEPVFPLGGGPGATNMVFEHANRYAADHDVVLVGYRGVDGSSQLDCPEVTSALAHSKDLLEETSFRSFADGFRSCAKRLTDDGVDLAGYSLAQQADDLEAARTALGYGQLDLLSESAGTRLAQIYAWRHPESIRRSVMIGVNPPGHFFWDAKTTDAQIRRYGELCAEDESCRSRTDDLAASMKRTAAHVPHRWLGLPIKDANVRIAAFLGLFETSAKMSPVNAPMTLDAWLSAADGDASGLWFASLAGDLIFPKMFTWGEYAAIGVQDARVAEAYFGGGGDPGSILGNPANDFLWAGGKLADAWPASPDDAEYRQVRTSTVETLLIGGELDFSTPPEIATKELLPYLPNGHQVVLANVGHSGSFFNDQAQAGTHLINTFLESGQVDNSRYKPASVDFTPGTRQSTIGKAIAGVMVALALLTVVSLLWMARRVHKRGGFGRKASAVLRSVYPVVLGLGGWFLGLLLVLMTNAGIPLDGPLLAVPFIGAPVGLGVYLAWVHLDWSAEHRRAGMAAAAAGALLGAVLGFYATAGLVSLLTAIAGAIAATNLALVVLDVLHARSGVETPDSPAATATPRPDLVSSAPLG